MSARAESPAAALATTVARAAERLAGRRLLLLTGAGLSTRSGIPDYRGPGTRRRARQPMQHRTFLESEEGRQRYWARSYVGWPRFAAARSNAAHESLAELEHAGLATGLITQNVDELHAGAGSRRVVELHGSLHDVCCLDCGTFERRAALQHRLATANATWPAEANAAWPATANATCRGEGDAPVRARLAPDGDSDLDDELVARFRVAACLHCGGVLKPHVVFFGGTVPRDVVDAAWSLLDGSDGLLVAGSSLAVFSGYRFVREAHRRGVPIVLVNLGESRADPLACHRLEGDVVDVLPALSRALLAGHRVPS